MPQVQDQSLDLLICSPVYYGCPLTSDLDTSMVYSPIKEDVMLRAETHAVTYTVHVCPYVLIVDVRSPFCRRKQSTQYGPETMVTYF